MPKYLGKGATFYLISCEFTPSPNLSFQEQKKRHAEFCVRCGFYKDAVERQDEATKKGKEWRKLICIHPKNVEALKKWKPYVTVWG